MHDSEESHHGNTTECKHVPVLTPYPLRHQTELGEGGIKGGEEE